MITLHFHLGPQYKYELFHTNFSHGHVCIAREHFTQLYSHLNSIDQHFKFIEEEKHGSIAFLDKTAGN